MKFRIVNFSSKSTWTIFIYPEQTTVKQSLSFLIASSIKSLLSQRAFCRIYLIVFQEQAVSKIFQTLDKRTVTGKIYKCLLDIKLISKLSFQEMLYEKYKHSCTYIFEQLLKNFATAKFLDSSARPEMPSITITLSRVVFLPKNIIYIIFIVHFIWFWYLFNLSSKSIDSFWSCG